MSITFSINDGLVGIQFEFTWNPDRLVSSVAEESDMACGFHLGTS